MLQDAADLAPQLKHPLFDCLYLALARRIGGAVITANKRLLTVAPKGLALALEDWRT